MTNSVNDNIDDILSWYGYKMYLEFRSAPNTSEISGMGKLSPIVTSLSFLKSTTILASQTLPKFANSKASARCHYIVA
jgi:hypothetical protein